MAYATAQDMVDRFGIEAIRELDPEPTEPVDGGRDPGVEYIYTSSTDVAPITGAANLPDPDWNFDIPALANGVQRGEQRYYDNTPPDLSADRPFQIRFQREVPDAAKVDDDIGTQAWTQGEAVRAHEHFPGVDAALADAIADIDAHLAMAYSLPLPEGTYPFLVAIACDLARLRLYDDDPTDAVVKRAEVADSRLLQLVEGKRDLVDDMSVRVERRQTASLSEYVSAGDAYSPNPRRNTADIGRLF